MIRSVQKHRPTSVFEIELQQRHVSLLVELIDDYVKKCRDSIDNFQVGNDRETLALLTATNSFADHLQRVVFRLTRINIKTYKNGQSNTEIVKIAINLSNYIYSIQKSDNSDVEALKQNLKSGLDGTKDASRQLHQLLQNDAIRGNVVTVIEQILFAILKLYYSLKFESRPLEELKNIELKIIKTTFLSRTENIINEDDATINNLIKYASQAACSMQKVVLILVICEEAHDFDDKTQLQLLQLAYYLNEEMAVADIAFRTKKHDLGALKEHCAIAERAVYEIMMGLLNLLDPNYSNTEIDLNLRNLVRFIISLYCSAANLIIGGFECLA